MKVWLGALLGGCKQCELRNYPGVSSQMKVHKKDSKRTTENLATNVLDVVLPLLDIRTILEHSSTG